VRRDGGAVAGAALALGVLAVAWAGLYEGVSAGRLLLLCLLGALPTLAALVPRARPAAIAGAVLVALPTALAFATRGSVWSLVSLDGAAWSAVASVVPDGLAAGSDASLPVSPADAPALVALLDAALVAMAAAAAWQIVVRRRPVLGLVIVGVGLAYRWTVEPPASGVMAGALALAALTAVLALSTGAPGSAARPLRHLGGAVVLGGLAVAVAAGLGTGPAKAGDPWWAWKEWDIGAPATDQAGGGLDLRQSYGSLDWPAEPRVAFSVASDRARPLRAVSLSEFDGVAFTLGEAGGSEALPVEDGTIVVPDAGLAGTAATQDVTLVGASSPVIVASGRPERIIGGFSGAADLVGDAIRVATPLEPGDSYRVRTRIPQPRPADLVAARTYEPFEVPEDSTRLRPSYWGAPVDVPLWGSGDEQPADALLGPYAEVRALARRVVGDAATPYAAVNRIEAHLRGGFVYDEQPPFPTSLPDDWPAGRPAGSPPLVDFVLNSRRGFCQHFAGSMAVMLRTVGIPARVAVGYTGGTFDSDTDRYRVLDRDAHSWVEVWFDGYGWLPFDPTPGRSAPNPASVSSPDYDPTPIDIDLGGLADAAVDPPGEAGDDPAATPDTTDPQAAAPAAGGGGGGGGIGWRWALAALVLPLGIAPARRAVRRFRGRRHGDERSRVVAATRELEASLAPLGLAPPAAASPTERAEAIRARTGVDPSALYRRAARARFAPDPPASGEADAAWRELSGVRREIRRSAPWRVRVLSALGLGVPARDTVG